MTEPAPAPSGTSAPAPHEPLEPHEPLGPLEVAEPLEVLEARQIHFVETSAPPVPHEERLLMDRLWDEAVADNPSLFDGPVVACVRVERDVPGQLVVHWARSSFRHRVLRRLPGARSWLPSLFVTVVQPTDDGRLLAGRMAGWTSVPGRVGLPGGGVEPPDGDAPLDLAALRGHAARELHEETGISVPAQELTLGMVTLGPRRNLGAHFLAPPRPAAELDATYTAFAAAERAQGREPELDRIAFLPDPDRNPNRNPDPDPDPNPDPAAGPAVPDGPRAEFLDPVLRRFAGTGRPPGSPRGV